MVSCMKFVSQMKRNTAKILMQMDAEKYSFGGSEIEDALIRGGDINTPRYIDQKTRKIIIVKITFIYICLPGYFL